VNFGLIVVERQFEDNRGFGASCSAVVIVNGLILKKSGVEIRTGHETRGSQHRRMQASSRKRWSIGSRI